MPLNRRNRRRFVRSALGIVCVVEATSGTRSVARLRRHLGKVAHKGGERCGRRQADAIDRGHVASRRALRPELTVAVGCRQDEAVEFLGTMPTADDGFGTRPDRCLYAMLMAVSPVNGSPPVSSS